MHCNSTYIEFCFQKRACSRSRLVTTLTGVQQEVSTAFVSYAILEVCQIQQIGIWPSLPSTTKLRQGNVFTPVFHSVHRGGVGHTSPLGRHPLPQQTFRQCMPGYTPCPPSACWDTHHAHPVHAGIHPPFPVYAGMESTSGRYTSYWNAFLLSINSQYWPSL